MKKHLICKIGLTLLLFISISGSSLLAQDTKATNYKKPYTTVGGEIIFSWADASVAGADATVITRFSPVFNFQNQIHYDLNPHVGFLSGINIHNVGFIYDDPFEPNTRHKARSYTIGVPVALKAGNMSGIFFFGGYEIEFPFNYKEKKFVNEDKVEKNTSWFSDKTPVIYNTLFAGIQSEHGVQLKFKYYLTNFFNKDYSANDGSGNIYYPYSTIDANVFYVSLSYQLRVKRFYH